MVEMDDDPPVLVEAASPREAMLAAIKRCLNLEEILKQAEQNGGTDIDIHIEIMQIFELGPGGVGFQLNRSQWA